MVALSTEMRSTGPVFDGRAAAAARDLLRDAQDEVAKQALAEVHTNLDASLKNPTPYYETQLVVERLATDMVVHDRGIVYGPWLEGVGSRNRTTRFKGYFSFRRAAHRLRQLAPTITQRVVRRHLGRMN